MRSAELSELKQLTSAYSLKKKKKNNKPFQPNLPQMCSCKWRSIYWPVFFSAQDWSTWFRKPGRLIWNADVETVKCTLPFFLCCICQIEKWLAQGSVTHTHLITLLGSTELSQAVVDTGAVPLLVLCIQEPEIALKRIAASALSDISKHSPELAQTVVDAGAIAHLAQMILNPDAKLKVLKNKLKHKAIFC